MKTLEDLNNESKMYNENDDFSIEELVNHVNEIEEFIVNNPGYAYVDYNDEHYNVYSFICKETEIEKYIKNAFEVAAVLVHRDGKCFDLPKEEVKKTFNVNIYDEV